MQPTARCLFEALETRQLLSGFIDLPGVMPTALDLPHINLMIRRPGGDPLAAYLDGGTTFNIDALYSTGASGIILSGATADALGINRITHDGQTVFYSDVGITASDYFNVSESLMLHLAPSHPDADLDNLASWIAVYTQGFGSLHAKISGQDGLDIIGMPAMADRVVVIDPKPLNSFNDTLRTYVYAPGTPYDADFSAWDPGIPSANLNVQLTYSSFAQIGRAHV